MPTWRRDTKGRVWIQTTIYILEDHANYLKEHDLKPTRVLAAHLKDISGIPTT